MRMGRGIIYKIFTKWRFRKKKKERERDKRWKLFASGWAKNSGTNKLYLKIESAAGQRFKQGDKVNIFSNLAAIIPNRQLHDFIPKRNAIETAEYNPESSMKAEFYIFMKWYFTRLPFLQRLSLPLNSLLCF